LIPEEGQMAAEAYPVTYDVEYQDRELNRVTTFFRLFTVIPIAIVLASVSGSYYGGGTGSGRGGLAMAGGALVLGPLLMILFREKYPRWWFGFNQELARFTARVVVYFWLMDDRYPSTDEKQGVTLELPYPDRPGAVNRWMVLVKWFLAIPHYVVLTILGIAVFVVIIVAWFAILFTGRYPRGMFDFLVGYQRWWVRVYAYAFLLVTDDYPPFRFEQ
jgi:hypothetical protein